jgi:glucokinase
MMQMKKDARFVIGMDLGGTNVRAAVITRDGRIIGEGRADSKAMEGLDTTIGQMLLSVRMAVENSGADISQIGGIGMAIPGTVRSDAGVVDWSPNFKDWNGVNVGEPITRELGIPAFMGNDASVAAFGEYTFGAGRGAKCMVMFTIGTGIGSGLVIDGHIYSGVSGVAAEMGHHIIQADGPRCSCGRYGCVEAIARRDAIVDRAARKAHSGRHTSLIAKCDHDLRYITPAMIAEAAAEGDAISMETLDETGYYIGLACSNAINILNPDKVVIGGGIAQAGDLLFDPIRRTVEVNALYQALQVCEVVPAQLGDDAGVFGGAGLVLQAMNE